MRSFLCAEFLDFAARRLWRSGELPELPACASGGCTGLGHLQQLAEAVAERNGESAAQLLHGFGRGLFVPLVRRYPAFFVGIESTVDLVARFDAHVAAEVEKLAPGFRLPRLGVVGRSGHVVEIAYRSADGLGDLAEGLLCGSIHHFAEPLAVESRPSPDAGAGALLFALRPRTRREQDGARPRRGSLDRRAGPRAPRCRPASPIRSRRR